MASTKTDKATILAQFFDEGAYTELYAGAADAVTAAFGSAAGCPAYAVVEHGGALSAKDVAKMAKVLEMAGKTGNPVVTYYDSVGADISEGLCALSGSAKLAAEVAKLSGVVPQIAVVSGVCGAGAALAAAGADLCIAVKGCELFFTPPFTAKAAGDKAENAASAESAAKAGVAHVVAADMEEAAAAARKLIALLPSNNLSGPAGFEFEAPAAAVDMNKYSAEAAAKAVVDEDSAVELMSGFGKNIYTALATVNGNVCGVVSAEKELCHSCVSKAARFVRLCDSFNIPVVTVVNTDGFVKSNTEDISGGLREAARLTATYADATTAKVCVVAGKAVGTAYTALCGADITIALDTAVVAPIEPEAAVTVLYKEELDASANIASETKKLAQKYIAEQAGGGALVAAGLADMTATADTAYATVAAALDMLLTKREQRLPKKHGNMPL